MNTLTRFKLIVVLMSLMSLSIVVIGCKKADRGNAIANAETSNSMDQSEYVETPSTEAICSANVEQTGTGTGKANEPSVPLDSRFLGDTPLEECTLEIIYDGCPFYRRNPLSLYTLYTTYDESNYVYRDIVTGDHLTENQNFVLLLKMLDQIGKHNLPPVQKSIDNYQFLPVNIYYSLRGKNGEKLFDVTLGVSNFVGSNSVSSEGGSQSKYIVATADFNGVKIPYHDLFYHSIDGLLTHFCTRFTDDQNYIIQPQSD